MAGTKMDIVAKTLIKHYKEDVPDSGFVIVENEEDLRWGQLNDLKVKAKRYRRKSFHIADIKPISNNVFAPISWGINTIKFKKYMLSYEDRQGIFKITFSDGDIMYFAKYVAGYGRGQVIEGLFATEKLTWYKFKKYLNEASKRSARPKSGFYKVYTTQDRGLGYAKIEKPSLINTIHPIIVEVDKDIEFFFKNTEIFTQYGQPGTRKVMLIGPPGTGKTSMCIKIARQFSKTMPVIVATDLSAVATHLQSCAKSNMRTLVILEDAESCMSGMDGATHSSILNFLDGIDQPVNTKGAYVIMTTNHPERIESRILKRPGRVDRLFQVGELEDHYALQCARLYFGNTLRYTNRTNNGLSKVVNGLTGAEIKELSNSSKAYAAQNSRKLSVTLIKEVRKLLSKDLSDAYRFAEENSLLGKETESFGFVDDRHYN